MSLKRIQDFLEHPDVVNMHPCKIKNNAEQKYALEMKNVQYSYYFNMKTLWDIDFKIEKGN